MNREEYFKLSKRYLLLQFKYLKLKEELEKFLKKKSGYKELREQSLRQSSESPCAAYYLYASALFLDFLDLTKNGSFLNPTIVNAGAHFLDMCLMFHEWGFMNGGVVKQKKERR